MEYGLIGEHLGHSYSCEIHARIGDYKYELCELMPEEVDGFLIRREFKGINVTIPYKQKVIPHLSELSEMARRIGAVNTVVNRGGKLYGDNTDFLGMKAALEYKGIELGGKKVLILGTGGTSRTAGAVADALGARCVTFVSREAKNGAVDYKTAAAEHSDCEIIINTTPVGMFPNENNTPVDLGAYPHLEGVMDVIYNPLRSDLVLGAQARGIRAIGGLYMLAAQAVYASAIFTGRDADTETIARAYSGVLNEKQNIVLVGMAGAGKTTVGKKTAEMLGKSFVDTDEEIVKKTGKTIPDIFAEVGEAGFRKIEHDVIADAARLSGCVISTGGGAVLDPSNVRALKRNGAVAFIDRRPEDLAFSDDRPLSQTREAAIKLYNERYGKYTAAADYTVINDGTPDEAVYALIRGREI